MTRRQISVAASLLLGIAAQGCSYLGSARDFDPEKLQKETGWLAVPNISPRLQASREDCGIAALEMVLARYDKTVPRELVEKACPIEPGSGSRAGEMRDFVKSFGLEAYLIHGELSDFSRELSRGHPVIIGLVKRYASGAYTHYEVAVAIHPDRRQIVTLDPANGWRTNSLDGFLEEWEAAARLTLVVFPREQSP